DPVMFDGTIRGNLDPMNEYPDSRIWEDRIIQEIIRQEFKDCTVLAIAHRMNTVIDSDLILVLGEGSILEYDAPTKLLQREDSTFSKLTKEYSQQSQHFKSSTAMHRMGSY
uniref:ABC transporter domain-containing protein n=1 Tax=Oryza glaberrima TaxID=4538 RepID=I1PP67_ORYGL